MSAAVAVRGLRVEYGGVRIVGDVDLDVSPGEWVTVIGPNGAGKSTLLRAVAGLAPATGTIALFGTPAARLRRRERARLVAMVPQTPVVPAGMRVFDYTLLGRTPYLPRFGRESAGDTAVVRDVLARLDLPDYAGRMLTTLSGGELQRVFLARALAQEPQLLLLDEPTSALDIGHQQEVMDLVDRLRHDRGLAVLSTMHDLSLAGLYADRIVLLAGGEVAAAGTARQVLAEDTLTRYYRARVRVLETPDGPMVVPARGS
ncbi:ABC transporter ATP-binding protein [Amycolatopsis silviterrae]|uniref:ABC transporter ATP-binding protein n=1 Tax=Amycolatopsis silviterrae TaxID=1656914 RepID=A0ABW5H3E5_9PSEU